MGYRLGVDLGTTYTACAVRRDDRVDVVHLGDHSADVPSVVFAGEDGTFAVGEAAERRGLTAPHRLAREFKRRIGDPTPLLLAGTPYSAHALTAVLLRWVVDRVVEREGGPPEEVVVTHPANWGPYKRESLEHGITLADVGAARLCSEPEAAVRRYASLERLSDGDVVAVYDLGGGTFDTAVLAREADGFALLGPPAGIEQLGGVDFDDALFSHVLGVLGPAVGEVDLDDEAAAAALARLRRDCVHAKEALSEDTEVVLPVGLPGLHTTVRLTRAEFEDLVRPALADTVAALRRALRAADVAPDRLSAVLLAGGSSRIPLVAETLSAELGRPVAVDSHPKHLVALGAALGGTVLSEPRAPVPQPRAAGSQPSGADRGAAPPAPTAGPTPSSPVGTAPSPAPPPGPTPTPVAPVPPAAARPRRPTAGAVAAALAATTLAVALLGDRLLGDGLVGDDRLPKEVLTVGDVDAGSGDPLPLSGVVGGSADSVTVRPALLGVQVDEVELERGDPFELDRSWLAAGPLRTELEVTSPGRQQTGTAEVEPDGALPGRLVSVPGAAVLVLLLMALAYGEALLKPVRHGRRAGPVTLLGFSVVGAALGLVTAAVGWLLGRSTLTPALAAICCATAAAAAVLALISTSRRTRHA